MPTFNLIDDPWIPVRWRESTGNPRLVGLRQLFTDAERIVDLSATPQERIALVRLLVCITQAAMGMPPNRDAWSRFGDDFASEVPEYLNKPQIHPHFNLFGDGPRFLQAETVESPIDPAPLAKLVFHFATGNTATLLDHEGESPRVYSFDFIARTLLTFQNFFVGGSFGRYVKGNGPSLKALHTFLIGDSLRETILLNCLDEESLEPTRTGRPVWECSLEEESDPQAETYLGRLVPMPCKLRLLDDGQRVLLGPGIEYPSFDEAEFREPSVTVAVSRKDSSKRYLLRANLGRGIWRDLHAISIARKEPPSGPLTLTSHFEAFEDDQATLWTGELIKAKDAKIIDAVESLFTIPFRMLEVEGQLEYEAGVEFATRAETRLLNAVKAYASAMKHESPPTEAAQRHYWNALDRESDVLLHLVGHPENRGPHKFGQGPNNEADEWTLTVRRALANAYGAVCPRQTPRQIEAYAAGLRVLNPQPKKKKKRAA